MAGIRNLPAAVLAAALAAAPVAAQWGAVPTSTPPLERTGALLTYDLFGGRMLLYGGNWTDEFWSLQNGTWTQLAPTAVPSPRSRANLATDTLNGTTLFYGGDAANGTRLANDETWLLNGSVWTLLAPAQTPGGLARHSMAFDGNRQTTVLFGGRHDSWAPLTFSGLTWEFAAGTWTAAAPLQSPSPRADAAMAYHPGINQVILFGGENSVGQGLADTWTYNGTTWNQTNTTGAAPLPRAGGRLVPILNRGICVLFGGRDPFSMVIHNDTWEHDGTQWQQVQGVYGGIYPPRDEFAIAHDLARDRIVVFGGRIANNALQNDTWEYGAQFTRFGNGCPGSAGIPALNGVLPPRLGSICTAQLTNLPAASTVALMAVGLSRTQWPSGSLPALLTTFGMPNCRAYTSADLFVALGATGGTANWNWSVPSWSGFIGQTFYLQGLSLDPGVNAAGLTVTNAATIVVGI